MPIFYIKTEIWSRFFIYYKGCSSV